MSYFPLSEALSHKPRGLVWVVGWRMALRTLIGSSEYDPINILPEMRAALSIGCELAALLKVGHHVNLDLLNKTFVSMKAYGFAKEREVRIGAEDPMWDHLRSSPTQMSLNALHYALNADRDFKSYVVSGAQDVERFFRREAFDPDEHRVVNNLFNDCLLTEVEADVEHIKAGVSAEHLFECPLFQSTRLSLVRLIGSETASEESSWKNLVHRGGSFWCDWYQGIERGKPLDWDFQRRVAQIDDEIWDAGPEAVAEEIERIKARYLSDQLPLAETVEFNPDTGKFRTVPVPVENASYMSALLFQIGDALEDCLGGHNGLSETSGDVRKLKRVLTKYRDDPQNAELTLTRVAGSLRAQLHESRELPDNEDNLGLLNAVEEGVRGIRANHAEVAANREQLAQQAFQALEPEEKQKLEEALPLLAEISDPALAEDFEQDIPELINDALRPLPDGAPSLPGADAATRVFNRVSKMALVCEKGEAILDSKEMKTARLAHFAASVGEMLFSLVQIGLRILGVL